jgi:hypothetical protein
MEHGSNELDTCKSMTCENTAFYVYQCVIFIPFTLLSLVLQKSPSVRGGNF